VKFYRVRYSIDGGNSNGFSWHTAMSEAKKCADEAVENDPKEYEVSDYPPIETIEIEPTKKGILHALKLYAEHADNG
jgi:predicted secreted protein